MRTEKTFKDFLIIFDPESKVSAVLDLVVYEIVGKDTDGNKLYNRNGYNASGDHVESVLYAEVFMNAYVKWDGCCEFEFLDVNHFCGYDNVKDFMDLLDYIHTESGKMIVSETKMCFKEG